MRRFKWHWNVKVLLFTAAFLPLLVGLGFWQLERAEEKQQILDLHQQRRSASPIPVSQITETDRQYLRVEVEGNRVSGAPTLLLDNRVKRGRPGYEVLNIVRTASGEMLLVNRGWLEGYPDRRRLPEVPALAPGVRLTGHLYRSPGEQLMLGEDDWEASGVLEVIQNAAPEKIAERLNLQLYDYSLRLDADSNGALDAEWIMVNVQPEKHIGYAVQWFTMAAVLLIMAVYTNSNLGKLWKKPGEQGVD